MFQNLLGIEEGAFTFGICVHFATLVAVCAVYYKDIVKLIKNPLSKPVLLIIVGTVPAVIAAVFLEDLLREYFDTGKSLGIGFLFTATVLLISSKIHTGKKTMDTTKTKDALIIGFAQAVALFPAVSRSGMTITTSLARGIKREEASKFSFLLSVPVILGAVVMDVYGLLKEPGLLEESINTGPFLVGIIAAGVSGYFAIRFMIKVINKGKLKYFSYYLYIVAALVLFDQLFIGKLFPKLFG